MARKETWLRIEFAPTALRDLQTIWDYNAEAYGTARADAYIEFLESRILRLKTDYGISRPVDDFPDLKYLVIQKRSRADGHVVVFKLDAEESMLSIIHIYHTKQDWRNKIR